MTHSSKLFGYIERERKKERKKKKLTSNYINGVLRLTLNIDIVKFMTKRTLLTHSNFFLKNIID